MSEVGMGAVLAQVVILYRQKKMREILLSAACHRLTSTFLLQYIAKSDNHLQ